MARLLFTDHALTVAPRLLGAHLTTINADGRVTVRITEVEAYHGLGTPDPYDPGSHARDRKTERNAAMFGPPGHAYVYLSYGVHFALNLVCSPTGIASGVLIRAGEVVEGMELAHERRLSRRGSPGVNSTVLLPQRSLTDIPLAHLARGPGNLAVALGVTRPDHNGRDLFTPPFAFTEAEVSPSQVSTGPRVGVSGIAGGQAYPWRFWLTGERSVSSYRPGRDVLKV